MLMNLEQTTAGECARQLMAALHTGSREQIGHVLRGIESLPPDSSPDPREAEFRDLLQSVAGTVSGPPSAPAQRAAALRMLAHVARSSI